MKVGDLIKEIDYPELGIIIKFNDVKYSVLCPNGKIMYFSKKYIEEKCEVISASR